MSVTIDGTNGITTPDITSSGSLNISASAPDNSLVVNSSGNVGIGTSSPSYPLQVGKTVSAGSLSSGGNFNVSYTDGNTAIGSSSGNNDAVFGSFSSSKNILFVGWNGSTNSERMRIDSSGNLLVGTTSSLSAGVNIVNSTNLNQLIVRNSGATAGRYWAYGTDGSNNLAIYNQAGTGVYIANGGQSWIAGSDETTKENLVPIENGLQKVNLLRSVIGNYIADEEKQQHPFLIAQDVQKVLPEAVSVTPHGTLGLSYTDTIPLLVAAIKELSAKNDALEARLAALEAK